MKPIGNIQRAQVLQRGGQQGGTPLPPHGHRLLERAALWRLSYRGAAKVSQKGSPDSAQSIKEIVEPAGPIGVQTSANFSHHRRLPGMTNRRG